MQTFARPVAMSGPLRRATTAAFLGKSFISTVA